MSRNFKTIAVAGAVLLITACHRSEQEPVQAQRIAFDKMASEGEQPLDSPDTSGAGWTVVGNGQAIDFGKPGERPLLTLICNAGASPPQVTIVRHARARTGEKALFPVIGNGKISRFEVDAAHVDGEWRWQGTLPADDPQLEVFAGPNRLEATLPGGGTVKIDGSATPGLFVAGCRGRAPAPAAKGAA